MIGIPLVVGWEVAGGMKPDIIANIGRTDDNLWTYRDRA